MSEKQPTAYVVCRYSVREDGHITEIGDNVPVKVFDTRREARKYVEDKRKRARRYGYGIWPVKQG